MKRTNNASEILLHIRTERLVYNPVLCFGCKSAMREKYIYERHVIFRMGYCQFRICRKVIATHIFVDDKNAVHSPKNNLRTSANKNSK